MQQQLHTVARALNTDIGNFFPGAAEETAKPTAARRLLLELSRAFMAIRSGALQVALCELTRAVAQAAMEKSAEAPVSAGSDAPIAPADRD